MSWWCILFWFQVCPKGVADRVNLGLIPSSQKGWPIACTALKPQSGGILHIHENVTTTPQKLLEDSNLHNGEAGQLTTADRVEKECELYGENVLTPFPLIESTIPKEKVEDSSTRQDNLSAKQDSRLSSSGTHNASHSTTTSVRKQWTHWANDAARSIQRLLRELHDGKDWSVRVIHIEHVKSYAPHVDHVVVDMVCRPRS